MKKMIAGLLGLALSMMLAMPSVAQNKQNSFNALAVGAPSYTMNSGGSFYGQVLNSGSASQWSLGFGSSQTTSGTSILTWNSAGHIWLGNVGAAPAVSSCGTTPSVAVGSDQVGDLTLGSATVTTCTLTFQQAFTTIPHCFVNNRGASKLAIIAQPTVSTLVFAPTLGGAIGNTADVLDYFCMGHAS